MTNDNKVRRRGKPEGVLVQMLQRDREHDRTFAVVAAAILKAPIHMDQKAMLLNVVSAALLEDRKRQSLEKELREAEQALDDELTEQNFQWLTDIKHELALLDGTEPETAERAADTGRDVESPKLSPRAPEHRDDSDRTAKNRKPR